jgi:hypothetical protein
MASPHPDHVQLAARAPTGARASQSPGALSFYPHCFAILELDAKVCASLEREAVLHALEKAREQAYFSTAE